MKGLNYQRGNLMLIAIILIVVVSFIGIAVSSMFTASSRASLDYLLSEQAFYAAESGLDFLRQAMIISYPGSRLYNCSSASSTISTTYLPSTPYSSSVTVSFSPTRASTFLGSSVTDTQTTIPVNNGNVFPNAGRVLIDKEEMDYVGRTNSTLYNVTRGVDYTTAAAHSGNNVPVSMYQCTVTSVGSAPGGNPPSGANYGDPYAVRTLSQGYQLEQAWAAGSPSATANNIPFGLWNSNLSPNTWTNSNLSNASVASTAIYSISMTSYDNGWAAGSSGQLFQYQGASTGWVRFTANPGGSFTGQYKGVSCLATNACFAVGEPYSSGGNTYVNMQYWNGSNWNTINNGGNDSTLRSNTTFNAVSCVPSGTGAVCRAVGNTYFFAYFAVSNFGAATPVYLTGTVAGLAGAPYYGISCTSVNDCWAVGSGSTFTRWNGVSWSNYNTGLIPGIYRGIYCNSSNDCWAVGYELVNFPNYVLLAHWNGTSWSNTYNYTWNGILYSVACSSPNFCQAVGDDLNAHTLILQMSENYVWSTATSSSLTSTGLMAVSIVGSKGKPTAGWQETF